MRTPHRPAASGVQARELAPQLVAWRRTLHRQPELAFEEHRTSDFVAHELEALGLEVHRGIAGTGVVGILRASGPQAPPVLLRADMDALPIQEVPGRDYGSQVPGRMHACGHDGHVAMLLGAAALLGARRERLERDVIFCFQPAEEQGGGARVMIEEGLLERFRPSEAYALHLWSLLPVGTLHVRPGPMMAAQDEFTARIVGRGGHGAAPHETRDPIVAAAQAVGMLQSVVARNVDPLEPAVVTVGRFEAGRAPNVIPEVALLEGTLRSFSWEVRELVRRRVREVLEHAARAAGCRLEFELREGYPVVVNDPAAAAKLRQAASDVVGETAVFEARPLAAAEDFAYFLERLPGAFALLGAGNEGRGIQAPHHSPEFDIDEAALPLGAELLARLALAPALPPGSTAGGAPSRTAT